MCNSLPSPPFQTELAGGQATLGWEGWGAQSQARSGSQRCGALVSSSPRGPVCVMSPASARALQRGAPLNICLAYLGLVKHGFLFCLHSSRNWVPMSWNLVLSPEVLTSCCFLAAAKTEL